MFRRTSLVWIQLNPALIVVCVSEAGFDQAAGGRAATMTTATSDDEADTGEHCERPLDLSCRTPPDVCLSSCASPAASQHARDRQRAHELDTLHSLKSYIKALRSKLQHWCPLPVDATQNASIRPLSYSQVHLNIVLPNLLTYLLTISGRTRRVINNTIQSRGRARAPVPQ